ncbi:triose-phosphate isomerase [Persicirhabdus sediminis]|uniref:triose-phosphate isomerase n=1 Tax=Persicirhabdus sediminis TaxID=454144 RepID=UPI001F2ACD3C|nr:triose-phosphate isomerase [Persicirhabdus sediminis]
MRKPIIAANWKMNHGPAAAADFFPSFISQVEGFAAKCDIVVAAPMVSLAAASAALKGCDSVALAAQNVSQNDNGAFTGETSTDMLKELGVEFVITGHSERRTLYGETNEIVNAKNKKVLAAGMKPIFCIGETLEEREGGKLEAVLGSQVKEGLAGISVEDLANVVIAYEPVWAIGTGVTATSAQAQETHAFVRSVVAEVYGQDAADAIRIQYGGSANGGNAEELLAQADIDGGLVGGASLAADSFSELIANGVKNY